jgi:hypothetical protein
MTGARIGATGACEHHRHGSRPGAIVTIATAQPFYQARWHFGRPVRPQPALVSQ